MDEVRAFTGESSPTLSAGGTVTVVEESSFALSGRAGDIVPGTIQGLFVLDMRMLSRWELTVDGRLAEPLAVSADQAFSATFVSRVRPAAEATDASPLVVLRRRYVGSGMREDITIRNHSQEARRVHVRLDADTDFADLFAVKEGRATAALGINRRVEYNALRLEYHTQDVDRVVSLAAGLGARTDASGVAWEVELGPGDEWTDCIGVTIIAQGQEVPPRYVCGEAIGEAAPSRRIAEWRQAVPTIRTHHAALQAAVDRSMADLGSLRLFDPDDPESVALAAGAPWFMTVFGRDSLLASYLSLVADPALAAGVLRTLARFQGRKVVTATEEQPGRILHEMRFTAASSTRLSDAEIYYGTADATPLFVVLLGELAEWGADAETVHELLPNADRALAWIEEYGDRDGDGFVEYARLTPDGLINQGWKDSWNGIPFADGSQPAAPIALAEVQGYVYAAYLARARLGTTAGDSATARRYQAKAADLMRRFNEQFWIPEKGRFAIALDADKHHVDALASNMGHCLWSGIVDPDKAAQVADALLSPEMFSGWGVRTLATSMASYDPMSYHCGSVWPHDNALIASGLMRYGFVDHANRIIQGMLDVASHLEGRLPELFSGMARNDVAVPVAYPASCSPQAWAAATPLQFVRLLLRLDPSVPNGKVWLEPALPAAIDDLSVDRVPVGAGLQVTVSAGRLTVKSLDPRLTLVDSAQPPFPNP